jgi:cardiolipin synthase
MRKLLRFLTSRGFILGILILAQFLLFCILIWLASLQQVWLGYVLQALSIIIVIAVVGNRDNASYKLIWCILILVFPLFGGMFYLLFGGKTLKRPQARHMREIVAYTVPLLPRGDETLAELNAIDSAAAAQARYLERAAQAPLYAETRTEFLPTGEEAWKRLLGDLERAQRFIFIEFFIVQPGRMWGAVEEILVRKVKSGVEVRLMFDDIGCLMRLPHGFTPRLRSLGIKVEPFNQLVPQLTLLQNNRDHRKITVIDGDVGYTGGINLADEYINAVHPFGENCHWKDDSIRIEGDAVWSFTVMFLQMWTLAANRKRPCHPEDFEVYRADGQTDRKSFHDGYVIPYGDSPLDEEPVGQSVYLNLINRAHNYLYLATPYLIIDDTTKEALLLAARRGVDVRIVTPHIPDKWYAFLLTRAHYPELLASGVRIYEYTPGFIHAKISVADGLCATVGTVNLDYRSFFMHFECGIWMYGSCAVAQVRDDFRKIISVSEEMTVERHHAPRRLSTKLIQALLRLVAPLM